MRHFIVCKTCGRFVSTRFENRIHCIRCAPRQVDHADKAKFLVKAEVIHREA